MLKRAYNWMGTHVHTSYAVPFLAALFFIESICFIPVDPILILFCLEDRRKSLYFALVATLASVAGGITAYCIGYAVWETIGHALISLFCGTAKFNHALQLYRNYEMLVVLIGGFVPVVPYKLITLTAGFCKLPLIPFIGCSLLARGGRFFLEATLIKIWGNEIKEFIDRYFNLLVGLFALLVIGCVWLIV
jgi:membrane protein YqaA with SNARE-associated domain